MRIVTVLVFVLLLMHRSVSLSSPQCHSCEQTSCICSRQNLTTVPAAPPKLITEFDLSFNRLREITRNDFVAFTGLRSLILNNNRIQKIQEQAFVPLTELEKLDLSLNRLVTLSARWFENLLSLRHLNLLGNKYTMLGEGNLFQSLKRLKILHFGGPSLQSVRKSDFSGLSGLEEVVFDGINLQVYAEGSLKQIGPMKYVTLGLNGTFCRNKTLVGAILSDVVHPNTTLTFTHTGFFSEDQMVPFEVARNGGTTSIIFKNVNMTLEACMAFLYLMSDSNLTILVLEDVKFNLRHLGHRGYPPHMDRLETLVLKNLDVPQFYRFPVLFILAPLLNVVRRVSVLNSKLFLIPCKSSADFSKLEHMDVSDNLLSDLTLSEMMCDGRGGLWSLQTINISRNHLRSINSQLFTKLNKLKNIDMSGNVFHRMPETCDWPPSLQFLNLSSTHLTKVSTCLPVSLRILDLSDNALTFFNVELPFLTELHISGNKISNFPDGDLYPLLAFLSIQNNDLQTFSSNNLNDYKNLKSLEAGANPYVCSCDFVAFMTNYRVTFGDEFKSYVCDSPDAVRGKSAAEARLSVFECHTALAFSLLCSGILVVFLLVVGLCHKFSVVWYVKMTWAWLRAKRKPKLKKGDLEYDAFVSYSESDSGWVEAHLVPQLEQTEPPLRLCLHKRDFVPGGWILDNIMDAIEKSHRTLFVLSQNFVRSEWCKYELDYTHFRLFDHNEDTVVLILLEPIDKETIPQKFCKLRRVMNSRTYLEWPDIDDQIPRFWRSLRTAIKRPNTDNGNCLQFDNVDF
ncbi:toll-like receptor 2 [Cottoperca gobio]|uniref:Toll-like receptor 2 n=1 Tax=Cottoperca gobio TaxID=56716 RepID=A0A6J2PWT1_COTGO|nr:toll-like receptor 2 [Cottoperca gobio]XP_029289877.1 toll-like receptor 2 [Cottoperca gobio]XP_029289887.1 toll-like receptor 2 [Cottoperca gobio]